MGKSFIAPEVFNCGAPDTGNAEVLHRYGSDGEEGALARAAPGRKNPLCVPMTEPRWRSSGRDEHAATWQGRRQRVLINGQKWWTSGAGDHAVNS